MKAVITSIIACAAVCLSSLSQASQVDGITLSHYEPLQRIVFRQRGSALTQKLRVAESANLGFDALGRTFELELEPNRALLSEAARASLGDRVAVYRGRLRDLPDSWARIVVIEGVPRGLVWDGTEMLAIEAPDDGLPGLASAVIYRLADLSIEPGAMTCGAPGANGAAVYEKLVGELAMAVQQGPGAVDEVTLGAVGDFEFTSARGGSADTDIVTRLNNVDGIFSRELGIQLSLQTVETFADAADPFTDASAVSVLIEELADYRQGNPAQSQQGLTHLYTGRDLDGSTVGVAYTGAVCNPRFGAGLSEANRGANIDSLIAAHEIGHNFGASHDGDPDGSCPDEPETFLMAPSVNGSDEFSPCSKSVMQARAANATCVNPLPSVDMTVGTTGQPASVLLGNAVNLTFDVTNNGTLEATNVSAEVSLPTNVSFIAASASQGTCTSGAATVSCSLGNVAGSSGGTVTVTASTQAVGLAAFIATVTADVDDNLTNNQSSIEVDIEPAVDLLVNPPASIAVVVDNSATVSAVLENTSIIGATGVTVAITLDAGLRADTASWTAGACSVAAQLVDCTATSFAAQSSSTLTLGVTGLTTGTRGYSVSMASGEADANPANNTVSGTVTVTSASGGDDGGGGATGGLLLWLLGGLLLVRPSTRRPVCRGQRRPGA